jgi:NitT/TauT family transport system ATP-binding protein
VRRVELRCLRTATDTPRTLTISRPESSLIVAQGVSKLFRTVSGGTVEALRSIDLTIDEGEFVCVVGPSGCGKSTFLRLIAGLDGLSQGSLKLGGHAIAGPSSEVGVVFQSANLLPWLNIIRNVQLPLRVGPQRQRHIDDKASALLDMVGLAGFEDKYPYELSGGMQQRAAICRALLRDPKVLLMDEPFGALDALTRERMSLELQKIWIANRKTVFFITHSIAEAVFLADRVLVMSPRPGRILKDFRIDLARPRSFAHTPAEPEYIEATREIRSLLDAEGS